MNKLEILVLLQQHLCETCSHWLHLLDFLPLCVFKSVPKFENNVVD